MYSNQLARLQLNKPEWELSSTEDAPTTAVVLNQVDAWQKQ